MGIVRRPSRPLPSLLIASSTANVRTKSRADYICDGTADQVQIQAALDALPSGAGKVMLSEGTFAIAASITISDPGTILEGQGWGTILNVPNGMNDHVIEFTPGVGVRMDGVVIKDLKIAANGANQTAGDTIYALGASWCKFINLWINQPWGNGIHLYQDNLGGFGHHNSIESCFIDDGEDSNGGDGRAIYLHESDENMVVNSTFQGNGRAAAGEPNHIFDTAGLNSVIGCQFVTGQTAIKFQGAHNKAIGNTFDGCQNHQMRINGAKNTISGNNFYNIGFGSSSGDIDGLWVDNVSYTTITGNFFIPYVTTAGCRSGINLSSGPSTNTVIVGNTFSELDGGTFGTNEIIPGAGAGNVIRSNVPSTFDNLTSAVGSVLDGGVVINEPGAAVAFRVESDNDSELLVIPSDRDNVGIGHSVPDDKLDVEGNIRVRDNAAATTKAYRLRTSGGALDFEAGGAGLYLSTWSGAGFSGTQYNQFVFANDGSNIEAQRDINVPDEAYGVGWNASLEVPTKNAVYDKIEAIVGASGIAEELAIAYAVSL